MRSWDGIGSQHARKTQTIFRNFFSWNKSCHWHHSTSWPNVLKEGVSKSALIWDIQLTDTESNSTIELLQDIYKQCKILWQNNPKRLPGDWSIYEFFDNFVHKCKELYIPSPTHVLTKCWCASDDVAHSMCTSRWSMTTAVLRSSAVP